MIYLLIGGLVSKELSLESVLICIFTVNHFLVGAISKAAPNAMNQTFAYFPWSWQLCTNICVASASQNTSFYGRSNCEFRDFVTRFLESFCSANSGTKLHKSLSSTQQGGVQVLSFLTLLSNFWEFFLGHKIIIIYYQTNLLGHFWTICCHVRVLVVCIFQLMVLNFKKLNHISASNYIVQSDREIANSTNRITF